MRFWFSRTRHRDETSAADGASEAKYDVDKWRDVIEHDEAIAAVAENLRPLGDKWVNEFARNYLSLNDKKRTWSIVQKVVEDARRERGQAERY
jgi:hypothetical protein